MRLKIGFPKAKDGNCAVDELFVRPETRLPKEVTVEKGEPGSLKVKFPGHPYLAEGYLHRPRRLIELVDCCVFDVAFVGDDILQEIKSEVEPLVRLPVVPGGPRVVLYCAKDDTVSSIDQVPAFVPVAAEYPEIAKKFFAANRHETRVVPSEGSLETEVPLTYRFGVSIVRSGRTLAANGLRALATLHTTRMVLIVNKSALVNPYKAEGVRSLAIQCRAKLGSEVFKAAERF